MSIGGSQDFITFTPPLSNVADPGSGRGGGGANIDLEDDNPFAPASENSLFFDIDKELQSDSANSVQIIFETPQDNYEGDDNPFSNPADFSPFSKPKEYLQSPPQQSLPPQQPQQKSNSFLLPDELLIPSTTPRAQPNEPNTNYTISNNDTNADSDDNPFFSDFDTEISVTIHHSSKNTPESNTTPNLSSPNDGNTATVDDDNPFTADISVARELGVISSPPQNSDNQDPFSQDPFNDGQGPNNYAYGSNPFANPDDPFSEPSVPQPTNTSSSLDDTNPLATDTSTQQTQSINPDTFEFPPSQEPPPVPQRPPKPVALTTTTTTGTTTGTTTEVKKDTQAASDPQTPLQGSSSDTQNTWISSRLKKATVFQKAINIWNKPHEPTVIGSRGTSGTPSSQSDSEPSSTRSSIGERPVTLQPVCEEINTPFVQFEESNSLASPIQPSMGDPQLPPQNGNASATKENAIPLKFLQVCAPDFHTLKMIEFEPLENVHSLLTRVLNKIAAKENPEDFKVIYPVFLGGQTMRAFEMDMWTSLGTYGLGMQVREDIQLIFILRNSVGSNFDFSKYEVYTKRMVPTPNDIAVGAWLDILDDWSAGSSSIRLIAKRKRLRKLTAAGIPHAVRGWAWCQLTDSFTIKEKNFSVYKELLDKIYEIPQEYERKIRVDLPRSLPNHPFFKEEGLGQDSLNRVLKCYCNYDKEIRYCQGINFLSAMLLCYMNERVNTEDYDYHSYHFKDFIFIDILFRMLFGH